MAKKFIQNHPGMTVYPPRGIPANNESGKTQTIAFSLAVLMLGVPGVLAYAVFSTMWQKTPLFYVAMTATGILLFALYVLVCKKFLMLNIREQERYYKITGATWLPEEKRAALQLNVPLWYTDGLWSETLEYWPATQRLAGSKTTFKTFLPTTQEERLVELDRDWGILSTTGYISMRDQLFEGMHSKFFAWTSLKEDVAGSMVARLSELTQLPEQYVKDCAVAGANRPALLLWGFDLGRVPDIARSAFMAGLISEEQAWKDILQASAYIHALFDNLDDYFNNYRLGNAFWSDEFKITSDRQARHRKYNESCNYPIKSVAWKKGDISTLPEVIRNGCHDFITEETEKSKRNEIGFRGNN